MKKNEITKEWLNVFSTFSESQMRWAAANKSMELGYGGISKVSEATGLSRTTIATGIHEIKNNPKLSSDRIRILGGGRKKVEEIDNKILKLIEKIMDETSAGDPMTLLKWTCKSSRSIAESLSKQGVKINHISVQRILKSQGYSLQSNKKMLSGKNNPNRDSQFKHINRSVNRFTRNGNPVISVDTKKKELVGNFKNQGETWQKKGEARKVLDHDFKSYGKGTAIPYGTYDIQRNEGFVNVGTTSDTSEFAVNSIWQWWSHFGKKNYKNCDEILICADGGGSNGSRTRAWKFYLQELANKIGISITVCHYPPGTSKWNKIEHRMFSFISLNWKGRPLENYEAIINLIASTKTKKGLKIKARLDTIKYEKGKKISKEDFDELCLKFNKKFPKWNYTITPMI
jgi:transposase